MVASGERNEPERQLCSTSGGRHSPARNFRIHTFRQYLGSIVLQPDDRGDSGMISRETLVAIVLVLILVLGVIAASTNIVGSIEKVLQDGREKSRDDVEDIDYQDTNNEPKTIKKTCQRIECERPPPQV